MCFVIRVPMKVVVGASPTAVGPAQSGVSKTRARCWMSRLSARLAILPQAALVELAASLCDMDATPTTRRAVVDKMLAARNPLPHWVVNDVLLSPDLLPSIFASLQLEDSAAAAACSSWRKAWQDTSNSRRGLRMAPTQLPLLAYDNDGGPHVVKSFFAAHPDGNWICATRIVDFKIEPIILDESLHIMGSLPQRAGDAHFATCSRDTLHISYVGDPSEIVYYSYDEGHGFAVQAIAGPEHEDEDDEPTLFFGELALGPNGTLFTLTSVHDEEAYDDLNMKDSLISLDARSLEKCSTVHLHWFEGQAYGMAMVESEICIGDKKGKSLHMLSLAGEPLRVLRGGWGAPSSVHYFDGRLYMREHLYFPDDEDEDDGEDEDADFVDFGKRVVVLTPTGETLQIWKTPKKQEFFVGDMLCFKKTLLLKLSDATTITLMGI